MKKAFLIILFLIASPNIFAQDDTHKKVTERFIEQLNNGDFENIYQTFSPKMQAARTKSEYFGILSRVTKTYGRLQSVQLQSLLERKSKTRGKYDGYFERGTLTIQITNDANGKIIGLYFLKDNIYL